MDLAPIEIARQLTVLQSEAFAAVPMHEFIGQLWNKKDKALASNIRKSIARFNKVLRREWIIRVRTFSEMLM